MCKHRTEAPRVTSQSFFLANLNTLDLVCTSGSCKWQTSVYKLLWTVGKIIKWKNGGKALHVCCKSVHVRVRWHSDLLKMRCIKSIYAIEMKCLISPCSSFASWSAKCRILTAQIHPSIQNSLIIDKFQIINLKGLEFHSSSGGASKFSSCLQRG